MNPARSQRDKSKRLYVLKCLATAALVVALGVAHSQAPESFEVYGKKTTQTFAAKDWKGVHGLPDVYCVEFPVPQSARRLEYAFYGKGAIFFTSVDYPNQLTVKIVNSSIPRGRSVEEEVARLLANEKRNAQMSNLVFNVVEMRTQFGPSVGLAVRNISDTDPARPYPLTKPFFKPSDGKVHSVGVHRLFVRGPDLFEVAVLQELSKAVNFGSESDALRLVAATADQVVASLQSCTAKMPVRGQQPVADTMDKVIDDLFPRQNSKLICSPPGSTRDSVRAALKDRLAGVDLNGADAANSIAKAIYTQFPCPFSPYRAELRPASAEDLTGDWLFPQASQKFRYGPKSPLREPKPGVPPINCEGISYFENGRQLVVQIGGTSGRCLTKADMKKAAALPRVENWSLIREGRVNVTRTDVENHIEEWDVFFVEKPFDVDDVTIEANDLVAFRRRDAGNDFNAATMFRHLQRMK